MNPADAGSPSGTLPFPVEGGQRVLREILAGGQSFLWEPITATTWKGIVGKHACTLELLSDHHLTWSASGSTSSKEDVKATIESYFATSIDFAREVDALPWRSDPVLNQAVGQFPGLRILRQSPDVALLSFLLSPLKRIEQIRAGLLEISRRWGEALDHGLFAPPSWATLASVPEADLRMCGIGYRARSIHQSADYLSQQDGYLDSLESLPTDEARRKLIALPGVGRKIADCVLLFGYGRLEAFPIDTWISRHMRESYGLDSFTDDQIQLFARAHYGSAAGIAQQFLFAHARNPATGSEVDTSSDKRKK
ncbi:DNA-3-methyladenine glycosylase 2 [Puniceicoccus vermicola]|uniref:DNA-(apurinic or apyrimidinic site) lyase n=1 Tax=Puniceicoccus vermicola TaxID=388746 RepID=A0A7X1AY97_9BACT|nr:DNA glycosylase [Puniceicoccus vermicola]MBC2602191.1 DNA-binding protein [Puniceicoccus vermicola]